MESLAGTHSSVKKSIVVGLGILVLLAGATTVVYHVINRRNPMSASSSQAVVTVGVPALDAETPEQTETATFAMG